jgi:ABC-type nitrate/sulfonate/bicarbonate transport system permease component
VVSVVTVLLAWTFLTETEIIPPSYLASPAEVVDAGRRLFGEGFAGSSIYAHTYASLQRWWVGVAAAAVVAVPFGVGFAWSPRFRYALTPTFETLRYIPPFAWVPVAILWFGPGLTAQAMVVYIAAFPPIVLNTWQSISSLDPILLKASQMLGLSPRQVVSRVAVPTALPGILVGIRIALGNGWMALMGAELIAGNQGLGFLVVAGQRNTDLGVMMFAMLMIGLLGALTDVILQRIAGWLTRWRRGLEAHG